MTGLTTPGPIVTGFVGCGCPEGEVIVAISFDDHSTLYGVTGATHRLITIDTESGAITDLGFAVGSNSPIEAIAFTPAQVSNEIPEPGVLTLTVSGIAALILRSGLIRRHRASR